MAKPYKRKDSRYWWIAPMINGVQVPQSAKTTDYDEALRLLRIKEGNAAGNPAITPKTDRGSFAALLELVRTDYKIKKRDSLADLERRIDKHLAPLLGHYQAGRVTSGAIAEYILARQNHVDDDGELAPAANGSINRELAIIKRAFRLGVWSGAVSAIPRIEELPEDNPRDFFYETEQFAAVLRHIHPLGQHILTVAYITGWRIASIRKLEWRQVDLKRGFVWLRANETKNIKAVRWPLMLGLKEVFETRRAETDKAEKRRSMVIPYVFHREGEPVRSIRTAWDKARRAAGLPGCVIHDFRGTAIVNLLESGVDPVKIMGLVGVKTIQTIEHYARLRGMREASLIEAADKLGVRLGITKT